MTDLKHLARMLILRPHHCVHCGRQFEAAQINALACSPRCQQARWRACAVLAGTHGYRNGRFKRLETQALKDD